MPTITNRTIRRFAGIKNGCDSTTEASISIGDSLLPVRVWRVKVKQTAGSAITFVPRVFKAAGASVDSIDQEFVGVTTAASSIYDAVAQADCMTDPTGKLYLRFGPNAGADNNYAYEIYVEVGR